VIVRRAPGRPDHISIEIADTGVGIAPDMLPQLFEKFTVAHDSSASKYGDTGLGLALALALSRLMGGEIRAESVLGKGSSFTVTLPKAPVVRRSRNASGEVAEEAAQAVEAAA